MKNVKFVKIEGRFTSFLSNRTSCQAVIAVNSEGKKGYLPNEDEPYMPIGGRSALKEVLDILEWR